MRWMKEGAEWQSQRVDAKIRSLIALVSSTLETPSLRAEL